MNNEEIERKLREHGFSIIKKYNTQKKIHVKDEEGYKYVIDLYNIIGLNQKAMPFHKSNPYTIENIQTYLNKFSPTSSIVSTEYNGNTDTLQFRCKECGNLYKRKWSKMKDCQNKVCRGCASRLCQSHTYEYVENVFKQYGYKLLEKEYIKNSQPLYCEDDEGYRYKISLQNLEKGRNPRKFSMKSNIENYMYNINVFIKKMNINAKTIEYVSNNKVKFLCECGEEFVTDTYKFISGEKRRCEKCTKKISGLELKVMEYFIRYNIRFIHQYSYSDCKNKRELPFDFYLPEFNTCIEVDGDQHFHLAFVSDKERALQNFRKIKDNDEKKNAYCYNNNINLIRIPYWKIKNGSFENILSQFKSIKSNDFD